MKEAAVERGCLHPTTSKIGCLAVLLADRVLLADKTPPFAFGSHHLSKKLISTYASHRRKSFISPHCFPLLSWTVFIKMVCSAAGAPAVVGCRQRKAVPSGCLTRSMVVKLTEVHVGESCSRVWEASASSS